MSEVGRPTQLDEELTAKIRTLVLEGLNYKTIQETLEINPSTWDTWVYKDYQGFRTNLRMWDNEILINIAKGNLHQLLQGDDDKIRADLTKFTLETLGKLDFSKKSEIDMNAKVETKVDINDEQLNEIIRIRAERNNS